MEIVEKNDEISSCCLCGKKNPMTREEVRKLIIKTSEESTKIIKTIKEKLKKAGLWET